MDRVENPATTFTPDGTNLERTYGFTREPENRFNDTSKRHVRSGGTV